MPLVAFVLLTSEVPLAPFLPSLPATMPSEYAKKKAKAKKEAAKVKGGKKPQAAAANSEEKTPNGAAAAAAAAGAAAAAEEVTNGAPSTYEGQDQEEGDLLRQSRI